MQEPGSEKAAQRTRRAKASRTHLSKTHEHLARIERLEEQNTALEADLAAARDTLRAVEAALRAQRPPAAIIRFAWDALKGK